MQNKLFCRAWSNWTISGRALTDYVLAEIVLNISWTCHLPKDRSGKASCRAFFRPPCQYVISWAPFFEIVSTQREKQVQKRNKFVTGKRRSADRLVYQFSGLRGSNPFSSAKCMKASLQFLISWNRSRYVPVKVKVKRVGMES